MRSTYFKRACEYPRSRRPSASVVRASTGQWRARGSDRNRLIDEQRDFVLPVMPVSRRNGRESRSVVSAIHQDFVSFACARPSQYECGRVLTSGELDYCHHALQEAGESSSSSADQPEHQSRAHPGWFRSLSLARISCPLLLHMLWPLRKRDFPGARQG